MRFIVYDAIPANPYTTSHHILRWGDAPADMIAIQAGDGEIAIPMPNFPDGGTSLLGGFLYDTSSEEWTFVGMAEPHTNYDTPDYEAAALDLIRSLLRESEWTQLPDAPLTGPQQAEWTTYRADLRSIAAGTYGQPLASFGIGWDIGPPPYPEF